MVGFRNFICTFLIYSHLYTSESFGFIQHYGQYQNQQAQNSDGIRLDDISADGTSGYVEIYSSQYKRWMNVTTNNWDFNDMMVACIQLGFSNASADIVQDSTTFHRRDSFYLATGMRCKGQEQKLQDCPHSVGSYSYNQHTRSKVKCLMSVRLLGNVTGSGKIEVFHNNQWGTICNRQWDNNDANVACRQLGYPSGIAVAGTTNVLSSDEGKPIWLSDMGCLGQETTLEQCSSFRWGIDNCDHSQDAYVSCNPRVHLATDRAVLTWERGWKSVLFTDWNDLDAQVVCRQLGFTDGSSLILTSSDALGGMYEASSRNFSCVGNESRLEDCPRKMIEGTGSNQRAGVVCGKTGMIRLEDGGSDSEGRVEILHDGYWGTVCDDDWDDRDAQVLCKQIGFSGGMALQGETFGKGTGVIWLDGIDCIGTEGSLKECAHARWNVTDCTHAEDAAVICHNTTDDTTEHSSDEHSIVKRAIRKHLRHVEKQLVQTYEERVHSLQENLTREQEINKERTDLLEEQVHNLTRLLEATVQRTLVRDSETLGVEQTEMPKTERYFLTLCGAVGEIGESAADIVYQLLTLTDMDDDHILGAYQIKHGLNMDCIVAEAISEGSRNKILSLESQLGDEIVVRVSRNHEKEKFLREENRQKMKRQIKENFGGVGNLNFYLN